MTNDEIDNALQSHIGNCQPMLQAAWHSAIAACRAKPGIYVSFYGHFPSSRRGQPSSDFDPGYIRASDIAELANLLSGSLCRIASPTAVRLARLLRNDDSRNRQPRAQLLSNLLINAKRTPEAERSDEDVADIARLEAELKKLTDKARGN